MFYLILKEYERLYTPSEWSKRYESEELRARFFKFCEEDAPIFIFIRGKYWQNFKDSWRNIGKNLNGFSVPLFVKNKIKVITVGYNFCPNDRIGDIVAEIKSAVAQILKYAADTGSKYVLYLNFLLIY
ncbi:hypothetical protein ALC57_15221 [Trachymyrmex cornetzi]|uniref:Uncharacterized protein n=1 Tax=Trachymyrmex cornetzi TaxID=471704 RepID=A0A195DJ14_9HYME|nr:hypothetical protein ALC57_15221 [Trachymyrmex cornetzi]